MNWREGHGMTRLRLPFTFSVFHATSSPIPRFASTLDPQHLRRVLARGIRDLYAAEHARDLLHALSTLQHADAAHHHAFGLPLGHLPLMVRGCGYLRQVGNAHHLMAL